VTIRPRRLIAALSPLCLPALLALSSCTRGDGEEQRAPEPIVPVRVERLRSFTFEDQVQATGQWRSKADLIVAAPFAGVLGTVLPRVGDGLRAGATVGTMTTLESHATLKGAELLLREAHDPLARREAERAVEQARHDLVQVPIVVPEGGVVVRRSAESGAQLAEGAEILALAPWTSLVFEAHVPALQGPSVHPGQRALIQEEGRPARAAVVERILPAADPTDQTTLVWLTPTTPTPAPQLQHFGSASITIGPAHASIAVTRGLLSRLNREELQAVVAHEMAHVQNYDTRLMTMLAAMVGAIALMSDGFGRSLRFGGRSSGSGSGGKDSNPLGLILLVAWLLTLIVAPIVSSLLSMAVSRKREYLADATGAQFTRNPAALASALEKLEAAAEPTRAITRGAAHLCIVDPAARKISEREGLLGDVFASHPPIRQRIIRLNGMAYQFAKAGGTAAGLPPVTG